MEHIGYVLLDIAFEDLKASELLYENDMFPQSIFYLQQSVEKSLKHLGLIIKIIEPSELHNKIGHKADKVFKMLLKGVRPYLDDSVKETDKNFENFKQDFKSLDLLKSKDVIKELLKEWRNLEVSEKSLDDTLYTVMENENPEFLKSLGNDNESKEFHDNEKKRFLECFPNSIRSALLLFLMNLLISDLVSTVRYPDEKSFENPAFIFDFKHPIVELLPDLHEHMKFVIKSISNFQLITME